MIIPHGTFYTPMGLLLFDRNININVRIFTIPWEIITHPWEFEISHEKVLAPSDFKISRRILSNSYGLSK